MMPQLEECPECGQKELRPDVTQGVTDCVNCGWSVSWLEDVLVQAKWHGEWVDVDWFVLKDAIEWCEDGKKEGFARVVSRDSKTVLWPSA